MKAQVNHKPPRSTTFRPKALTPAQANAIELFLVGKGDTEVAQILGIARETAWSWRKENPCFMAALQRRRAEVWGTAGERLRSLMAKAVDNIAGLVQTWPRPPGSSSVLVHQGESAAFGMDWRGQGGDRTGSPCLRPWAARSSRPRTPWGAGTGGGLGLVAPLPRLLSGLPDALS